jgi:hypothetical protein
VRCSRGDALLDHLAESGRLVRIDGHLAAG